MRKIKAMKIGEYNPCCGDLDGQKVVVIKRTDFMALKRVAKAAWNYTDGIEPPWGSCTDAKELYNAVKNLK